jgi:hypothetical protein
MNLATEQGEQGTLDRTYANLVELWTSGVRDYHTLLSDYLTANSIFVAAIVFLLARQSLTLIFTLLVVILCTFGILMTIQMAILLGRFSAQNRLWEWQLRGLERLPTWPHRRIFMNLHRFRDERAPLEDPQNDPPTLHPPWAIRQHRQWWARREVSFPFFFGIVYGLLLIWAVTQLLG